MIEEGVHIIKCETPSTTTSDDSNCTECQKRRENNCNKSLGFVNERFLLPAPGYSMPPHRLLEPAICACTGSSATHGDEFNEIFKPRSIFYVHETNEQGCADCCLSSDNEVKLLTDLSMKNGARHCQIYETAFDSKITRSEEDIVDELCRINSQELLCDAPASSKSKSSLNKLKSSQSTDSQEFEHIQRRSVNAVVNVDNHQSIQLNNSINPSILSQDFDNLHIDKNFANITSDKISSSSNLPNSSSRFKPSPPSTAPLPLKFPRKHEHSLFINSNKSAPNLPMSNVLPHSRLRDIHPTDSEPGDTDAGSTPQRNLKLNLNPMYRGARHKERPQSMIVESKKVHALKNKRIQLRNHQRIKNFSSTESMTTSSSGGSMESIRSSTSEGNRSTTSYESRHSTSLSSHSSDSGSRALYPLRTTALIHSKLHILSPISDKSSLEHTSEIFDNNIRTGGATAITCKNNNDGQEMNAIEMPKTNKMFLQNKNLLMLGKSRINF